MLCVCNGVGWGLTKELWSYAWKSLLLWWICWKQGYGGRIQVLDVISCDTAENLESPIALKCKFHSWIQACHTSSCYLVLEYHACKLAKLSNSATACNNLLNLQCHDAMDNGACKFWASPKKSGVQAWKLPSDGRWFHVVWADDRCRIDRRNIALCVLFRPQDACRLVLCTKNFWRLECPLRGRQPWAWRRNYTSKQVECPVSCWCMFPSGNLNIHREYLLFSLDSCFHVVMRFDSDLLPCIESFLGEVSMDVQSMLVYVVSSWTRACPSVVWALVFQFFPQAQCFVTADPASLTLDLLYRDFFRFHTKKKSTVRARRFKEAMVA